MTVKQDRFAGVLLHPSSLPSRYGIGDFGRSAYRFVDFLERSHQTLWQVLPFSHTGFGDSPYQSFSAFAGQPLFVDPEDLKERGLLTEEELDEVPEFPERLCDYGPVIRFKTALYWKAYARFFRKPTPEYEKFVRDNKFWLPDYALFMALKDVHDGRSMLEWEDEVRRPTPKKKKELAEALSYEAGYYCFVQYLFFEQWMRLKAYANEKNIRIVGDIPIFVSMDSADTWSHPELFLFDSKGFPLVVAGVPPDYFSQTGQLWGNPLYDWEKHQATGFAWWVARVRQQLKMFDFLRIDHFRGFESFWAVPAKRTNAIKGKWMPCPGQELFETLQKKFRGRLPIWAEDLGVITPKVERLRDHFGFPGMKVLQFAFMDLADNAFLPHRYANPECICYTGTHDNDTSKGWYEELSNAEKDRLRIYLNTDASVISWDMIRCALSSVAKYAIYPMQDLLSLGSEARMNVPSVPAGNWQYRMTEEDMNGGLADYLAKLTDMYGRG